MNKRLAVPLAALAAAGDAIAKEGRVLSAANLKRLEGAMNMLKEMLEVMQPPAQDEEADDADDTDSAEKGATTMKLADILRLLGLDPEKEVDVPKAEDKPPADEATASEETTKRANALAQTEARFSELQKRADEADKRAQQAETIARAERELRVAAEFRKRAEAFDRFPGSLDEKAALLRKAFDASEDEGKRMEQTMKSVQEQLVQSDVLLREYGRPGVAGQHVDGEAEIDSMAKSLVAKNASLTYEQAYAQVLKSPEGLAAYERVVKATRKGAN